MSFRICIYPSPDGSGAFTAHCLELDLMGESNSIEAAISELLEVIETQIETCRRTGAQFLFPAPAWVWQKYSQARKAGRRIADELIDKVVSKANKRLGHQAPQIENVLASRQIPQEYLATV